MHDIRFCGKNFYEILQDFYLLRAMYNQSKHCYSNIVLRLHCVIPQSSKATAKTDIFKVVCVILYDTIILYDTKSFVQLNLNRENSMSLLLIIYEN